MADEFGDDEYHFSEDESTNAVFDEETLEPARSSGLWDKLSKFQGILGENLRRNVLIGIGALIVLLILYKFLGAFFSTSRKTHTVQQTKPAVTKQIAQAEPVTTPTPKPEPVYTQPAQLAQPVQHTLDPSVSRKLSNLEKGSEKTQDDIAGINDNVDSLKNTMSKLGNQLSMLNANIAMLTQEVKQQQEQIAQLKEKKKRPGYIKRGKIWVPAPQWYIQAVIPGRAWLISKRGKSLTVRVGSNIPGYGTVKAIEPHKGLVMLKSGKRIEFKASDT